ncbi:MAG: hypothetical protein ACLGIN_14445 [Candidatus Sericytochromatia bacterium]
MRHAWMLTTALTVALAAPAFAAPKLEGTFVHVSAESDSIDKAIEQAVTKVNFLIRGIAHSRLKATNEPYGRITFDLAPKQITITMDDRKPIVTPASGQAIKWKREDGEVFDVSTRWVGESLEQTFSAEDGKRVNRFSLGPDGQKLTMKVTVSSGKLPQPLTYTLVYRRQ